MNAREIKPAPGDDEGLAGRAEVTLLTVDGADFRRVGVEAQGGLVTLSGEVGTESEKRQAAAVVLRIDGVHQVRNQLQVGHQTLGRPADDQALKDRVEAALGSDKPFEGLRVALPHGAEGTAQILENAKGAL